MRKYILAMILIFLVLGISLTLLQINETCIVCTAESENFPYLVDTYHGEVYRIPLLTLEQWKERAVRRNETDASIPYIIKKRGQGFSSLVFLQEGYTEIIFNTNELLKHNQWNLLFYFCKDCIQKIKEESPPYNLLLVENVGTTNSVFYPISENTTLELNSYITKIGGIDSHNQFCATLYIK